MKWFSENEFKCKCCGELPEDVAGNVRALVKEVLDPLREKYGKPIRVNSGYRCKHHNLAVGGAVKSLLIFRIMGSLRPKRKKSLRSGMTTLGGRRQLRFSGSPGLNMKELDKTLMGPSNYWGFIIG